MEEPSSELVQKMLKKTGSTSAEKVGGMLVSVQDVIRGEAGEEVSDKMHIMKTFIITSAKSS